MKQSVKIIVRNYEKKNGGGKFTSKSLCKEPTEEGIYEVAYEEGKLWIDSRPQVAEKNIVRIEAAKVVYSKPLPKLDKDIRAK